MSTARASSGPRIVTFYSYKGGTGRSMILANLAWLVASSSRRVLVIDWDLEAPGLHRFFHPFLIDKELASTDGVIDFVTDYCVEAISVDPEAPRDWYLPYADMSRYAVALDYEFPSLGRLDLVPAGRQGTGYASRVNSFDWSDFYGRLGGAAFLDAVRESMRQQYDYVFIDSRTGVSDTSGICTVHMPDAVALCFTLNRQSIEGAAAVASSVSAQRSDGNFGVFPIPTRIENAEKAKLDRARDYARKRFDSFLGDMTEAQREQYWGDVEVMYQPFYAYEEVLASVADRPGQQASLLASIERITNRITPEQLEWQPIPQAARAEILRQYELEPTLEQSAEIARLREEISQTSRAAQAAGKRTRRNAILGATAAVIGAIGAIVGALFAFNVFGGSSNTPDRAVSRAAIIGVLSQESEFFAAHEYQKLYDLFSSAFQAECPFSTFKEKYSAFHTETTGTLSFQDIIMTVDGINAYVQYKLSLGTGSSKKTVQVTSDSPDAFVFENGDWLNDVDSDVPPVWGCNPATSLVGKPFAATS